MTFRNFDAVLGGDPMYYTETIIPLAPAGGLQNRGTWNIDSDNSLTVAPGTGWTFNNTGTFAKTGGAGKSVVDVPFTTSGTVRAGVGTLTFVNSVSATGGSISSAPNAFVSFDGTAVVPSGASVALNGNLIVNGTFNLGDGGSIPYRPTWLQLTGDTTLIGPGQTVVGDNWSNNVYATVPTTLTIGAGHTLRGGGMIGQGTSSGYYPYPIGDGNLSVVNRGTLLVDGTQQGMWLSVNSFDNTAGSIRVADGSALYAYGAFANIGSTIQVGGGATLSLGTSSTPGAAPGVITGGTIQMTGTAGKLQGGGTFKDLTITGAVSIAGAAFSNVTIAGPASVSGTTAFSDMTFNDNVTVADASNLSMTGTQRVNGTFTFGDGSSIPYRPTWLQLTGDTTLIGPGQTVIGDNWSNNVYATVPTTLTIGAGHTLRGGGMIGQGTSSGYYPYPIGDGNLSVVNRGTLLVDGTQQGMWLSVNSFDNTAGSIRVADGSALYAYGAFANIGSTIQVGGGATLSLGTSGTSGAAPGVITGGTIQMTGTAGKLQGGGTFKDLTITGAVSIAGAAFSNVTIAGPASVSGTTAFSDMTFNDNVTVADASNLSMTGTQRVNGTFTFGDGSSIPYRPTWLQLTGDTTLIGPGQTVIGDNWSNNVYATVPTTLTIGAGHTLRGGGMIGQGTSSGYYPYPIGDGNLSVVNRGTLLVDGTQQGMWLSVNSFDNTAGSIRVADGSALYAYGAFANTGSTIQVGGGATLSLGTSGTSGAAPGVITGGTIQMTGAPGKLQGGGTLKDLTIAGTASISGVTLSGVTVAGGLTVQSGSNVSLAGPQTINGTLTLGDSGANYARVYLNSDSTLAGSGQTVIGSSSLNEIRSDGAATRTLTIAAGHTLRGGGSIGADGLVSVENNGKLLIDASPGMMLASAGGFQNTGKVSVMAGATLDARSTVFNQTAVSASLDVDGVLQVQQLNLNAGRLDGSGTVVGDVVNLGGVIAPGHSPGKLSIVGNLLLGEGSHLLMDVDGDTAGVSYDWLAVSGSVLLDGSLTLVIGNGAHVGDTFSFVTSQADSISGTFDTVSAVGYSLTTSYTASGLSVTISGVSPVPETPSYWMLSLGLVTIGCVVRRRV
ncbi:hypothetical protein SNE35_20465 [Paucibacter sp. R3-3]|uniref:PEP-CTERM protein-sorting domain-containing protein n=1 Tax=Roseateles agri TaxID=3098619 RepID=A0ABU5DME3_9BURK|nr:hypothetical protein [Paucibacter sp. R3-3]MDY0746898.1 hypothetical protein [Paucibacter sp. R3-3]